MSRKYERIYEVLGVRPDSEEKEFYIDKKPGSHSLKDMLEHLMVRFVALKKSIPEKKEYRKDFASPTHVLINETEYSRKDINKLREDLRNYQDMVREYEQTLRMYANQQNWYKRYNNRLKRDEYLSQVKLSKVGYRPAQEALNYGRRLKNENSLNDD